ncbi:hypothetical protein JB92DRAFT_3038932 [Gautieria morchelliformis]|nr:hypothetical protein JB92DRAFT_3038932 [Gautieria morchelliformis]
MFSTNSSTGNTSTTTDTKLRLQSATLLHPVRMEMPPSYDPWRSLKDYELSPYDVNSAGEYTVTVGMPGGRNEQLFKVQLDTGSSSDRDKPRIPQHTLYYPGSRARCHGHRRFAARYRDGTNLEGSVYTDTWSFQTRASSKLSVKMIFGVAEEVACGLALSRIDGILGLGFKAPSRGTFGGSGPHTLSTVLRSKDLTMNYLFCIGISQRGFLSLGCIPPHVPNPGFWIPVISGKEGG